MPLNCSDGTYRSFEQQVLPELDRRGIAVLGMKSLGGDGLAKSGVLKVTSTDLKNWDVTFNPTAPSDHGYEAHPAGLVDLRAVGCELVPEAIQINALAPGDEPLGIRAAEGEMPEERIADEVVPGWYAWNWSIHHDQLFGLVGIAGRISIGNHIADIVPDNCRLIDVQRRKNGPDIRCLSAFVVALWRM